MGKDKRTDNKSCEKGQQEKVNRRTLHAEVSDGFILCIGNVDSVLLTDFVSIGNIKLTATLIPFFRIFGTLHDLSDFIY